MVPRQSERFERAADRPGGCAALAAAGHAPVGITAPGRRRRSGPARVRVGLAAALLIAGAPPPSLAQDIEDLPPLVMRELKAGPAGCPEEIGTGWTCGQYRGTFNRLKFDLEVELDLQDFEARPLEPWRLKQGRYSRSWNVREQKVTMLFDPSTHVVMIRQGPLDTIEAPAEPEPESGPGGDVVSESDGGAR